MNNHAAIQTPGYGELSAVQNNVFPANTIRY